MPALSCQLVSETLNVCSAYVSLAIVAPPGYAGCYSFPGLENEAYGFVYWLMPLLTNIM